MQKCTAIYARLSSDCHGTDHELVCNLQATVEDHGDLLAGIYIDDPRITGRGRYAGWRRLLGDLEGIDQIILADAGDLPGRTVQDLLALLTMLAEHQVGVAVPRLEIDTATGPAAILGLIAAFRRARWTAAIRAGQDRARAEGIHVGRPPVPPVIRSRIAAALEEGSGVRPTARRFKVSPALVVAIRHQMQAIAEQRAA